MDHSVKTKSMILVMILILVVLFSSSGGGIIASAAPVNPDPDPFSGKYPIEVTINSPGEAVLLNRLNLDIDNVQKNVKDQQYPQLVTVYVSPQEDIFVKQSGLTAVVIPNRSLEAFRKYGPGSGAPNAWPTYEQWVARMQGIASAYNNIVRMIAIGRTVQNRTIWCLKISDNPDLIEDEPEFKYSSTMHGNEPVGAEMILRLAEYLTQNYSTNPTATQLVNGLETWLCPIHNPDGYVAGSRYNAHGVDLNRNFPDRDIDPIDTMLGHEMENQAFMNLGYTHHFVMGANYHTGALVVNYVWDCCTGDYSPDDALFYNYSVGYASRNPMILNGGFQNGVTIGWQWYEVNGGMQDWAYNWRGEHHVTIEISDYQYPYPDYSEMTNYWNNNREAMLWWMGRPLTGVRGIVTDAVSGTPLDASVLASTINKPVKTDPMVGDYHRMLLAGTYTLQASAFCHVTQSAQVTIANSEDPAVIQNFVLQPSPNLVVHGVITDQNSEQPLQATVEVVGTHISTTSNGDGQYSLPICAGNYLLRVSAPLHQPAERTINLNGDQVQDFGLNISPSTLLVDDDMGANYQSYYQTALNANSISFDTWNVAVKGSPSTAVLQGYRRVVWFTGDDYLAALTPDEQTALATYLNSGGKLFLSGQDIAYNINGTPFLQDYVHTSFLGVNPSLRTTTGLEFLTGLTPLISGAGGANNQHFPGDIAPLNGAIPVINYPAPLHQAAVAYQNDTFRVVFFSIGFEAINNASTRSEVMKRTLDVLDGIPADLSITKSDGRSVIKPGDVVIYTIQVNNPGTAPIWAIPVMDTFPLSLAGATWTCLASPGSVCGTTGGTGNIVTTINLAANGSATFLAQANLSLEANGTVINGANLTVPFGIEDTNLANNTAVDEDFIVRPMLYLPVITNGLR